MASPFRSKLLSTRRISSAGTMIGCFRGMVEFDLIDWRAEEEGREIRGVAEFDLIDWCAEEERREIRGMAEFDLTDWCAEEKRREIKKIETTLEMKRPNRREHLSYSF